MPDQPAPPDALEPAAHPLPPTPGAPDEPAPLVIQMPVDVRSAALSVLAAVAIVLLLQYAQSVFIPIVIALLVSYAIEPLVTGLARVGVARAAGAAVAVALIVAAIGLGSYTLSGQVMQIVQKVPVAAARARDEVRARLQQSTGPLQTVQRAATAVQKTANEAATSASPPARPPSGVMRVEVVQPAFDLTSYLWAGGLNVVNAIGNFTVILFLVYFFLVTGDLYKRKLVKIAGPRLSQKRITVEILDEIDGQIASFIRIQFLTSALVAVATGAALWWLGLEEYVVWGLLAGIFNSIPYLGPVIVTGGLGIVTFLQFDDLAQTAIVCAVALAITSVEGLLLTPALMSRAARMNAAAVFVGLLFWSWVWGIWGTVLAVPMLMMLKAVCDHVEDLQPMGELLGE
ncbi:MAG TPA: AI-2E family transporter [Vicinamibacterales bacterium]|nr:AI-2E family transporter [Vicinamibacterales bacterium]